MDSFRKYSLKYFLYPTYQDEHWFCDPSSCIPLDENLRELYIPDDRKSCKYKVIINDCIEDTSDWIQLKPFESNTNCKSNTATSFIGSFALCMEWLPLPSFNQFFETDYLLVASLSRENCFSDYENKNYVEKPAGSLKKKGLLQIWSYKSFKLNIECCFTLDDGLVCSMEVVKGGTSYSLARERLGLIALAFEDGFIRIYSIPFISSLKPNSNYPPIYRFRHVVILEPPFTSFTSCNCLSWSWTDSQRYLAAGYGNGAISFFDLATTSSLLFNDDKINKMVDIKPLYSWWGHGAIVTSIQIIPLEGSNIIVSGSWDRNIFLWNLNNTQMIPSIVIHRSMVDSLLSPPLFPDGFFLSIDHSFLSSNQSSLCFKKVIDESPLTDSRTLFSLPCDDNNLYSLSMSLYFNSLLFSDSVGRSFIYNHFRVKREKRTRNKKIYFCPVFTSSLENLNEEQSNKSSKATERWLINPKAKRERSYFDMIDNYGIVFNDVVANTKSFEANISKAKDKGLKARLADYPICCIRKSIWSPNVYSKYVVANLLHSGFIRVSDMSELFHIYSKELKTKSSKNESQQTETKAKKKSQQKAKGSKMIKNKNIDE